MSDKAMEANLLRAHASGFKAQTAPSLKLASACGNSYCASVWGGLASLVESEGAQLAARASSILLFSYGSGCASSMMLLRARHASGSYSLAKMTQQVTHLLGSAQPGPHALSMQALSSWWCRSS